MTTDDAPVHPALASLAAFANGVEISAKLRAAWVLCMTEGDKPDLTVSMTLKAIAEHRRSLRADGRSTEREFYLRGMELSQGLHLHVRTLLELVSDVLDRSFATLDDVGTQIRLLIRCARELRKCSADPACAHETEPDWLCRARFEVTERRRRAELHRPLNARILSKPGHTLGHTLGQRGQASAPPTAFPFDEEELHEKAEEFHEKYVVTGELERVLNGFHQRRRGRPLGSSDEVKRRQRQVDEKRQTGMKPGQIAAELQIPVDTVRQDIFRLKREPRNS